MLMQSNAYCCLAAWIWPRTPTQLDTADNRPHGNVCVEERAKQLELCEEIEVVEASEDK